MFRSLSFRRGEPTSVSVSKAEAFWTLAFGKPNLAAVTVNVGHDHVAQCHRKRPMTQSFIQMLHMVDIYLVDLPLSRTSLPVEGSALPGTLLNSTSI